MANFYGISGDEDRMDYDEYYQASARDRVDPRVDPKVV
jgi:hypothetical protein